MVIRAFLQIDSWWMISSVFKKCSDVFRFQYRTYFGTYPPILHRLLWSWGLWDISWLPLLLLLLLLSRFSRVRLCATRDGSPLGCPIPGILRERTLEWVAISSSNAWKWKVKVKSLSRVGLVATPWTAAYQPPPSMGFSRQEYWSGLPVPSPMKLIAKYKNMK